MLLFWLGLVVMCSVPLAVAGWLVGLHYWLRWNYLAYMVRIFQEKPLFIVPRGQPVPEAEDVSFPTTGGLTLKGCYFRAAGRRRGVILFGLEFGSNRWACVPYCQHLVNAGYDVFAFESRNQGDSDRQADYEPLQWVTDYEVEDARAALRYLKERPDADPRGVGLFGISKGAGAGLLAAVDDAGVRCFVTDGLVGLRQIERERRCHFPHLERVIGKLAPRPLLMIHGEGDTYIKPEMARALFARAGGPKEFWRVAGAKHSQGLHVA